MLKWVFYMIALAVWVGITVNCTGSGFAEKNDGRYIVPIFDKVNIEKDIVFTEVMNEVGKMEKLRLDVYTPVGDTATNRRAILWIHGGGFRSGNDKSQSYIVTLANEFAKRGYVCISIDYRIRENPFRDFKGMFTDCLSDTMTAMEWVRSNSKKLGVDKNRMAVGGGSAGGMIAVNLCTIDELPGEKWDKRGIVALIDLWGTPDNQLMWGKVDAADPPTIIIHGTADQSVSFSASERLTKILTDNGVYNELHPIQNAGHTPVGYMKDIVEWIAGFLDKVINMKSGGK